MQLVANSPELVDLAGLKGEIAVPALAFLTALFVLVLEQLVQWRYGVVGALGMLLLSVGIKTRSQKAASAGAVLLAVLLAGPAL
jgi:hypothetical protein